MKDDPQEIAAWLVQEHGLEEARRMAMDGAMQAQQESDNYALSVWREVKRFLAGQAESEIEPLA